MRLINADALIEGYRHMGYDPTEHPEESYMEGWCKGFNAGVDHCTQHAIHAPAIESGLRGRWIDHTDDGYVECPFCGSATNCDGNKDELHYCFSCGADMREEEEQ